MLVISGAHYVFNNILYSFTNRCLLLFNVLYWLLRYPLGPKENRSSTQFGHFLMCTYLSPCFASAFALLMKPLTHWESKSLFLHLCACSLRIGGHSKSSVCPLLMEAVYSNSNANDEERCDLAEVVDDLLDAESGVFRLTHWGQRSFIYSRGSPQHVRELQENGHGLYVLR